VSGDAGCSDKVLAPTARSFDASGLDQTSTVRIYLYMFADRATYERLRTTVDACAASFVTDPQTYQSVEQSPFVMVGQGPWGQAFEAALRAGLIVAAGRATTPGQTTRRPRIFRAITSRWIWLVPSPISVSLASRR